MSDSERAEMDCLVAQNKELKAANERLSQLISKSNEEKEGLKKVIKELASIL